jgi:hypothetical protein
VKFLKANLFLLITLAAALIGGAALYFLGNSASADMDKSVESRVSLDQRVTGMIPQAVNEKSIAAVKELAVQAKRERQEKANSLLKKNGDSERYPVLTFVLKDSNKVLKAFPYDNEQYVQSSLWFLFPQEYDKALTALLDKVKPTAAPSVDEQNDERARVRDPNAPAGPTAGLPGLSPFTGMGTGMNPGVPGNPAVMSPGSPVVMNPSGPAVMAPGASPAAAVAARTPAAAASQPAEGISPAEKAMRGLVWAKSQQGWVYADKSALFVAMSLQPSQDYKPEDYWTAQVSLWVQQDILDAIQRTNQAAQEAREKTAPNPTATEEKAKDAGVCVSPVKRLVSTNFRGYVAKIGGAAVAAPGAAGAAAPSGANLQYVKTLATHPESAPPSLTGRGCNGLYDVVHYDFTVIISPRYLRTLIKNLRQINFHTVLDVEINSVTDVREAVGLSASKEDPDGWYYYGTDPVVKARIVGEMLLMTDWTRGRKDESGKNWDANYPPLMPVGMLELLAASDPSCLRKIDSERIAASGGSIGPAPAAAAPAGSASPGGPVPSAGPVGEPAPVE